MVWVQPYAIEDGRLHNTFDSGPGDHSSVIRDSPVRGHALLAYTLKTLLMEVIWQREAEDHLQSAIRLIMDDDGWIMFQFRSLDVPEWTDVDELPIHFKFAV